MGVKVKICGITNLRDALLAVDHGADALGFIFSKSSPRYIKQLAAREIIDRVPPFVTPVGVFVNQSRVEIRQVVGETGIRALQFHGDESPDDLGGYAIPVYKAFRVDDGFRASVLATYPATMYLLDTFVTGLNGGTGRTFDWRIAADAGRFGRIILSGGLTPENIQEAVRIARPYAVDVNSGVESSPGRKDGERIRQLFAALRTN